MTKLDFQKKIAAKILKVGKTKVWLDPEHLKDIKNAITRADIRKLILKGWIKALPGKIKRKKGKRKRKGPGRRKGGKYAKISRKRIWMNKVRTQRKFLRELKKKEKISISDYRKLYKLVKGGVFRSRAHLSLYLKQKGIIKD